MSKGNYWCLCALYQGHSECVITLTECSSSYPLIQRVFVANSAAWGQDLQLSTLLPFTQGQQRETQKHVQVLKEDTLKNRKEIPRPHCECHWV